MNQAIITIVAAFVWGFMTGIIVSFIIVERRYKAIIEKVRAEYPDFDPEEHR